MNFFPDPDLPQDFGKQWILVADVPGPGDQVEYQYIP